MTRTGTMLTISAALAVGAMFGGGGLVQARLGTGGETVEGRVLDVAPREASGAVAPRAFGQCITNRTAFRTQSNGINTASAAYEIMPNTHFPVTHNAGCLIVDFSGEMTANDADTLMQIKATIPGTTAEPSSGAFLGRSAFPFFLETRSMRFVFPNLPAGTHTVRIEWRASGAGSVTAASRTMTVQYR